MEYTREIRVDSGAGNKKTQRNLNVNVREARCCGKDSLQTRKSVTLLCHNLCSGQGPKQTKAAVVLRNRAKSAVDSQPLLLRMQVHTVANQD